MFRMHLLTTLTQRIKIIVITRSAFFLKWSESLELAVIVFLCFEYLKPGVKTGVTVQQGLSRIHKTEKTSSRYSVVDSSLLQHAFQIKTNRRPKSRRKTTGKGDTSVSFTHTVKLPEASKMVEKSA